MKPLQQDYQELDAAILKEIGQGNAKFEGLTQALNGMAQRHCEGLRDAVAWRVIDRRLQALRKKNLIEFSKSKGCWVSPNAPQSN